MAFSHQMPVFDELYKIKIAENHLFCTFTHMEKCAIIKVIKCLRVFLTARYFDVKVSDIPTPGLSFPLMQERGRLFCFPDEEYIFRRHDQISSKYGYDIFVRRN